MSPRGGSEVSVIGGTLPPAIALERRIGTCRQGLVWRSRIRRHHLAQLANHLIQKFLVAPQTRIAEFMSQLELWTPERAAWKARLRSA